MRQAFIITLRTQGFTLVEMAVVLIILALMFGGLFVPISAQIDQRNYVETQESLEEIKGALIGYALIHGHFPCPAKSVSDGSENRIGTSCTNRVGHLPWAELAVSKHDAWNHLFRYSVTPEYSSSTKIAISPLTGRDITILSRDQNGNQQNLSKVDDIPVVIMSMGKNGVWGYSDDGARVADVSVTNIDEDTNGNGDGKLFFSRVYTENTAITNGEFDDVVMWISTNVYLNRMISAGQLP